MVKSRQYILWCTVGNPVGFRNVDSHWLTSDVTLLKALALGLNSENAKKCIKMGICHTERKN